MERITGIEKTGGMDFTDYRAFRKARVWKVYFEGNFQAHYGRDHAGAELEIGKELEWCGHRILVPAAYVCGRGLVVDFCLRVEADEMQAFTKKWGLNPKTGEQQEDTREFSPEEQMRIDAENPLAIEFRPELVLNGQHLEMSQSCGVSASPCMPVGWMDEEAAYVMKHYDLDRNAGWQITRASFPWKTSRRPKIWTLEVILKPGETAFLGPHFRVQKPGETVLLRRPETEEEYQLTVKSYCQEKLPDDTFAQLSSARADQLDFPSCVTVMGYTVTPSPETIRLTVMDCAESDSPRTKNSDGAVSSTENGPVSVFAAVGADREDKEADLSKTPETEDAQSGKEKDAETKAVPLASAISVICLSDDSDKNSRIQYASSALHFEPADDVEWRVVFYQKQGEQGRFSLI